MIHTKRSKPCRACPQRQEQNKQQIPWTHCHKGQRNASQRCKRAMVGWSSVRVWVGLVHGLVMMVVPMIHAISPGFKFGGRSRKVRSPRILNFFESRTTAVLIGSFLVHLSSSLVTMRHVQHKHVYVAISF